MPRLHRLLGKTVSLPGQNGSAPLAFHTPGVKRTEIPDHSPILVHHPSQFGPNGTSTQSTAPTKETTNPKTRGNRLPLGFPRSTR